MLRWLKRHARTADRLSSAITGSAVFDQATTPFGMTALAPFGQETVRLIVTELALSDQATVPFLATVHRPFSLAIARSSAMAAHAYGRAIQSLVTEPRHNDDDQT